MTNTRLYWLHTLSPTHVGCGRGVGYIDLPLHREKVTNWPVIPGSAFKGVWRDWAQQNQSTDVDIAFGRASDTATNASNSGSLIPTDARLLCLPVRSFYGTFAWCTAPLALQLFHRDLVIAGVPHLPAAPTSLSGNTIHRADQCLLEDQGKIFLEDLDFTSKVCPTATAWANKIGDWLFPGQEQSLWRTKFIERFAVVPDTIFDFLTETGTEVAQRVKIDDDSKTVAEGALWNEESLPAETILYGLVNCARVYPRDSIDARQQLIDQYATHSMVLQIGGKATVGRGRVRCSFTKVEG